MKPSQFATTTLLAICLLGFSHANAAAEHDAHHGHTPAKLTLDHGKKWPTDPALRSSMGTLRKAFAEQQHALHQGKLGTREYQALAASIDQQVANIVATCKLPANADAMLHLVIGELLAGAQQMKGSDKLAAGAHQAVTALNSYGRYFDHPGWQPLH